MPQVDPLTSVMLAPELSVKLFVFKQGPPLGAVAFPASARAEDCNCVKAKDPPKKGWHILGNHRFHVICIRVIWIAGAQRAGAVVDGHSRPVPEAVAHCVNKVGEGLPPSVIAEVAAVCTMAQLGELQALASSAPAIAAESASDCNWRCVMKR